MKFRQLVRWWLAFIILMQPVHERIISAVALYNGFLSRSVSIIDEITIIVCFMFAAREYYIKDYPFRIHLLYFIPMTLLIISGSISGIMNDNSLIGTYHALFLYIRSFLFIFIFAAFFREPDDFRKLFRLIFIAGIFLAVIAISQELWAVTTKYFLSNKYRGSFFYYDLAELQNMWRVGLFRPSSLMGHYNMFGIYMLLIVVIYFNFEKKKSPLSQLLLFSGIFLSLSRVVYAGFIIVVMHRILKGRKRLLILMLPILAILIFSVSSYSEFDLKGWQKETGAITYREYARTKALEIWQDHPYWGVGPGMFGWGIADKYNSHLMEEYNFFNKLGSSYLDQYWPQLLSELGLVGTQAYAALLFWVFIMFLYLSHKTPIKVNKSLYSGFAIFMIALLLYSFGGNLIIAPVLNTYFALVGIAIGRDDINVSPS